LSLFDGNKDDANKGDGNEGWIAGDSGSLIRIRQGMPAPVRPQAPRERPFGFSLAHGILRFYLPQSQTVRAVLFGLDGKPKRRLLDGSLGAGGHALDVRATGLQGGRLAGGVYVLRVAGGTWAQANLVFIPSE
jgi:hypothetical protein